MKQTFLLIAAILLSSTNLIGQSKKMEDFKTSEKGVKYKFERTNDKGQKVQFNDLIIGKFSIQFGDSLIADGAKMPSSPLLRVDSTSHVFQGDLVDGALMMKKGEKCVFVFERDSILKLYGNNMPAFFAPGMKAYWTIEIDDIKTAKEQEEEMAQAKQKQDMQQKQHQQLVDSLSKIEPQIINQAIEDYGFDNTKKEGVYIKKIQRKSSPFFPEKGNTVKVNYVGKFCNGQVFDQSQPDKPLEFKIGSQSMIKGFEEAVKMMCPTEKAIVLIPSELAYGKQGRGMIPPCTPLIFELELVEIVKEKITPPPVVDEPNPPTSGYTIERKIQKGKAIKK
ncbi:MAG: FKBP-type peptidyl-prolyl cis-trans isomerase [Bacteroidales bacterium]|jgi:FKBP-type peptidyl-prolyl cis-trans isomerase|nr:FKBP-type peptidyl-prolyl cis-trans isomerase [Bacteroidales bacterium]